MICRNLLCAAVLTLLLPFHLFAWGHKGHEIVAQLAMRQLSSETRQKVLQVLGTMTSAEAGNWMDDVRQDPAYKYTAPWHYTNIEPGATYQPATAGDIITALNTAYNELHHIDTLSQERLRFDVLVLFHLCGDLTQPLHVGYGSDRGGNDYQIQYNGKGTNLHHIWDTDIIESQGITLASFPDSTKIAGAASLVRQGIVKVDFTAMLNVNREFLPSIYDTKGHKLDETYLQKNKVLVEGLLQGGGSLLALCLEEVFSQAKNIPAVKEQPSTKPQPNAGGTGTQPMATVPADQAAAYIGQTVIVCGKVYSAKFTGGSGITFINMGGDYPNNPFTAVIMFKNRSNFTYKPEEYLNGKMICVTGVIKDYKGKPEIIVEKENQIRVQ